jgi:hypothetical protein
MTQGGQSPERPHKPNLPRATRGPATTCQPTVAVTDGGNTESSCAKGTRSSGPVTARPANNSAPVSPRSAAWAGGSLPVGSIPTSGALFDYLSWADLARFARSIRIASDYERTMRQVERLVGKP